MNNNYNVDDILDEIKRKKSDNTPIPKRIVVTKTEEMDTKKLRRAIQNEPIRQQMQNMDDEPLRHQIQQIHDEPIRRNPQQTYSEPPRRQSQQTYDEPPRRQSQQTYDEPPRGQFQNEPVRRRIVDDTSKAPSLPKRDEKLLFGRNVKKDLEEFEEVEDYEPRSVSIGNAAKKPIRPSHQTKQTPKSEGFKLDLDFDDDDIDDIGKTQMNIPINKRHHANDGFAKSANQSKHDDYDGHEDPSYKKGRQKKISQFVLNSEEVNEPVDDNYDETDENFIGTIDDYCKPSDKISVAKDISSIKLSLCVRLVLTVILLAVSIYLAFALTITALPLLPFMFPESNMRAFVGVNLGIMVFATLICNTTVGGGLISLFTLKADNDSPIAIASIAAIACGVALVISPDAVNNSSVHMYFAIVICGHVFNTIGKLYMISRISKNFDIVSDDGEKMAMCIVKNRELAKHFTSGYNLTDPVVVYDAKADFLSQFLDLSYSEDNTENISRISTPILTLFSLVASIATFFFHKDIYIALSAFTAMLCICSPFTATVIGNLPLYRASKSLTKNGAMISGYTALENFSEADAIIIRDNELFERGAITLHGIKAFAQERIDEAILDAASVICACNGILTDIFMQMIGSKTKLLKKVDSIVYEDCMGISAWVAGKRVLIGNRELMIRHDVDAPSADYEAKFVRDGREVLYISNSGELTAMFVVSYNGGIDIIDELKLFSKKDISLIIHSNDCNITSEKISTIFGYPEDLVRILPAKLHSEYDALSERKANLKAEIAYPNNIITKLKAIKLAISTKNSITLGSILQLIGVFLGYALVVFFAFTGSMSVMDFKALMVFQVFFSFVTILIPNLKKY